MKATVNARDADEVKAWANGGACRITASAQRRKSSMGKRAKNMSDVEQKDEIPRDAQLCHSLIMHVDTVAGTQDVPELRGPVQLVWDHNVNSQWWKLC